MATDIIAISPCYGRHTAELLVVPYEDSNAIYVAMQQILQDEKLQECLVRNGWASIRERFELQNMIQKTEQLYGSG